MVVVVIYLLCHVQLFATPWTVAYQAPSMGFSRQECWSGLPFPSPRDLPYPGIEPRSPALQAYAFTVWATREAIFLKKKKNFKCILSVNICFRHQFKKKIRNENQWSLSTIWDTLKIQIITNVLNYTIHCSLSIADVYISI